MDGSMVIPLREATADTCGGKSATLATLLREGLPVPDGFVVPFAAHRRAVSGTGRRAVRGARRRADHGARGRAVRRSAPDAVPAASAELRNEVARWLAAMDDPLVAVRSSAANEDTAGASAAGQYESVIAVRGPSAVSDAVRTCWASARSARVADYWRQVSGADVPGTAGATGDGPSGPPDMAVLVQRLIEADVSGVMFTPLAPGAGTRIEASWGLGLTVVGGAVSPDAYEVTPEGNVLAAVAHKTTRADRSGTSSGPGVGVRDVPDPERTRRTLDDATAAALANLGERLVAILGQPQDVEWAVADGKVWILQARPITAPLPPLPPGPSSTAGASSTAGTAPADRTRAPRGTTLTGLPGAHGIAGGIARVLRGPAELARVERGDILVCRFTEPAWTPAFGIAGGVVTETGGVLSHAAIVAREHGIPAVLGVAHVTTSVRDGARITVDGTAGTVTVTPD